MALIQHATTDVNSGVGGVGLGFNVNLDIVSIAGKIDVVVSHDMAKWKEIDEKQDGPKQ